MAYNSSGVEYQFLKNYNTALEFFKLAVQTAQKIPSAGKLIEFMENSYREAEKKLKSKDKIEGSQYEYKNLPSVTRGNAFRNKSTPPPPLLYKSKLRFLTGDRLTPMYTRKHMNETKENIKISKTLENIQNKIGFLQTKLENFHKCVAPLKDIKDNDELNESFSMASIENFTIFNKRNAAAKKIQKFFRKYLDKQKASVRSDKRLYFTRHL